METNISLNNLGDLRNYKFCIGVRPYKQLNEMINIVPNEERKE